jgi:hypothetical protein
VIPNWEKSCVGDIGTEALIKKWQDGNRHYWLTSTYIVNDSASRAIEGDRSRSNRQRLGEKARCWRKKAGGVGGFEEKQKEEDASWLYCTWEEGEWRKESNKQQKKGGGIKMKNEGGGRTKKGHGKKAVAVLLTWHMAEKDTKNGRGLECTGMYVCVMYVLCAVGAS